MTPADEWAGVDDHLWLVNAVMGTVVAAADTTGAGRYVLLRVAATLNHEGTESDRTYALGLTEVASVLSGLISLGSAAFGREAMTDAMADALHMTEDDRRQASREAVRRLREDR